jgi:hypothetical protein
VQPFLLVWENEVNSRSDAQTQFRYVPGEPGGFSAGGVFRSIRPRMIF